MTSKTIEKSLPKGVKDALEHGICFWIMPRVTFSLLDYKQEPNERNRERAIRSYAELTETLDFYREYVGELSDRLRKEYLKILDKAKAAGLDLEAERIGGSRKRVVRSRYGGDR